MALLGVSSSSDMPVGYYIGNNFAAVNSSGVVGVVTDYANITSGTSDSLFTAGTNVLQNNGAAIPLTQSRTIRSLMNNNAADSLSLGGYTLALSDPLSYPASLNGGGSVTGAILTATAFTINGTAGGGLTAGTTSSPSELVLLPTAGLLTINAPITDNAAQGSVSVTKGAANNLTFSGTLPNTYTGTTYLSGGTTTLSKSPYVISIPGNVVITAGAITLTTPGQIADNAAVTIINQNNAGTLTVGVASVNETIGSLTINALGGTETAGAGNLNLSANSGDALAMTGGTIATCTLSLSGSGAVHVIAPPTGTIFPTLISNQGAYGSVISSAMNLNAGQSPVYRTFNIEDGPAVLDLTISSIISSNMLAGITKTGSGTLQLSGDNQFYGMTTVSGGTLSLAGARTIKGGLTINAGGTVRLDIANALTGAAPLAYNAVTVNTAARWTSTISPTRWRV